MLVIIMWLSTNQTQTLGRCVLWSVEDVPVKLYDWNINGGSITLKEDW